MKELNTMTNETMKKEITNMIKSLEKTKTKKLNMKQIKKLIDIRNELEKQLIEYKT